MTRKEFETYLHDQKISPELQKEYWRVYDKINEPGTPLSFSQRANFLLAELRKMKNKKTLQLRRVILLGIRDYFYINCI